MITGKTRYVAIIGHPVSHTLSPQMHQAAFNRLHLDYCYLPFDISPPHLKKGVEALKLLGFQGFNVTLPHKEKIIFLMDQVSPEASIIGAVNTVLIEGGNLIGFNTDGAGFTASIKKQWNFSVKNKQVVVLGAGGAAKAVAAQMGLEKVKSIGIANRTRARGIHLIKRLKKYFPEVEWTVLSSHGEDLKRFLRKSDLLINATSVGLRPDDPSPSPGDYFYEGLKVCDLIYNPPLTPFLKSAQKKGCPVLNGAGMLLYQGALAFKIWTGKMPPVETMAKALSLR